MTQQSKIFLSYAHIDNAKLRTAQAGWVDDFDEALINELRTRGLKCMCWRDKRGIRADQFFDDVIRNAVDTSSVFIAVVSPNYVDSAYCLQELSRFSAQPSQVEKVMKVVKYPIDKDDPDARLPDPLRRRVGFQFFKIDRESGEEFLYWNAGTNPHPLFYDTIREVARSIRHFLPEQRQVTRSDQQGPLNGADLRTDSGPVIFLAEPSGDLESAYRSMRGELETKLGARVVPEQPLPREEAAAVDLVKSSLAQASHSIHLLGRRYGYIPDGESGRSIVALQLELAKDRGSKTEGFCRMIWQQPDQSNIDSKLLALIQSMQREGGLAEGDHLVEETLERFKSHVLDVISRTSGPKTRKSPVLFVICAKADEELALGLRRSLQQKGLEVRITEFESSESELREAFARNAKRADAILVVYGASTEAWVLDILHDLSDWRQLGRKADFKRKGILLAGRITPRKLELSNVSAENLREDDLAALAAGLSRE